MYFSPSLRSLLTSTSMAAIVCGRSIALGASAVETAGDVLAFALPATALVATFATDDKEGRLQFAQSFLVALGTTATLKLAIDKPRPEDNGGHAFPSGHTAFSFQGATFIHRRYGWTYGVPAYLGAAYVGWSRVESNQHDWADVSAGAAIGLLSSWFFTKPFKGGAVSPLVANGSVGLQFSKAW